MLPRIVHLFESGDVCSLGIAAGLLLWVGQLAVATRPRQRAWGERVAALAFLLWLAHGLAHFVYDASALAAVTIRGLIAAAMTAGLSWLVLPFLADLYNLAVHTPAEAIDHLLRRLRGSIRDFFERRRARRRQRQADRAWRRAAPEREAARREEEQRRQHVARTQAIDRRRRADARLTCELLYDRHAADLAAAFPRQRLDSYFAQYLSDEQPADLVEQRAVLLQQTLKEALHGGRQPGQQFSSIEAIAAHFSAQKKRIEQSDAFDEETKDTLLRALNQQEDQQLREFPAR